MMILVKISRSAYGKIKHVAERHKQNNLRLKEQLKMKFKKFLKKVIDKPWTRWYTE